MLPPIGHWRRLLQFGLVNCGSVPGRRLCSGVGEFRFGQLAKAGRARPAERAAEASAGRQRRRSRPNRRDERGGRSSTVGAVEQLLTDEKPAFKFGQLAAASSVPVEASSSVVVELTDAADELDSLGAPSESTTSSRRPLGREGRKHDADWYLRRVAKLTESGDTVQLLKLFYSDMLGEDRYLPTLGIVHSVLKHLANVGAYEESRAVINKCKSIGLQLNSVTHCHYFSALARAGGRGMRNATAGKLAYRYYERLLSNSPDQLNSYGFNLAALACARNGLVQETFKILDDSLTVGDLRPQPHMLEAVLLACHADAEVGAALALVVWRRFRRLAGFRFNGRHYYRLLQCLHDCGIGRPELDSATGLLAGVDDPHGDALARFGREGDSLPRLRRKWSAELDAEKIGRELRSRHAAIVRALDQTAAVVDKAHEVDVHDRLIKQLEEEQERQPAKLRNSREDDARDSLEDRGLIGTEHKNLSGTEHKNLSGTEHKNLSGTEHKDLSVAGVGSELVESDELKIGLPASMPMSLCVSSPVDLLQPDQSPVDANQLRRCALPWQRLALIGGLTGLIESMARDGVKLELPTVRQLLRIIPAHWPAEKLLLHISRRHEFYRDVRFFNSLLQYRVRHRLPLEDTLEEMRGVEGVVEDRDTFAAMALACANSAEAQRLLDRIAAAGAHPDQAIFHNLLLGSGLNFNYKSWLIDRLIGYDLQPTPAIVRRVEQELALFRSDLTNKDPRMQVDDEADVEAYKEFKTKYEKWLRSTQLYKAVESDYKSRVRLKKSRKAFEKQAKLV